MSGAFENISISKMSGAGNDFVFIDLVDPVNLKTFQAAVGSLSFNDVAQKLCNRDFSIGADGAAFLLEANDTANAFRWKFINADGSNALKYYKKVLCTDQFQTKHLQSDF